MIQMMKIKKKSIMRASLLWLLVMILSCSQSVSAQSQVTISRRDIVIDLGDGLITNAQLTYPSISGEFCPGILLVHGSGNTDMDEYLPPEVSNTEEGARPFLQIAEYLSKRGIAVLRYNKRGIGSNGTILDAGVVTNTTFQNLLQDAETALEVLLQQPEVNKDDITILGHSEGTWIAPRIAIEDHRVKKIVLMSAGARNLNDILYFQIVERGITMFEELDDDHNGLNTRNYRVTIHYIQSIDRELHRRMALDNWDRPKRGRLHKHRRGAYPPMEPNVHLPNNSRVSRIEVASITPNPRTQLGDHQ
jgi:pimeloyl-ACP methyl ester carboxylesterase